MNKVVSIHLNGRTYQLEEAGYEALRAYLDEAGAKLASDPGKTEIIADLEQAIAEKCDKLLTPHKTVVLADEVTRIIAEMGPVEGEKNETGSAAASEGAHAPKRLFLMGQNAMVAGVCAGLATYFDIDVTLMRVIFVVGTILTSGAGILVYVALALLIPYADTAEAMAAAHGEPLNAHTLAQRAKERWSASYERVTGEKWDSVENAHERHLKWKQMRKEQRRQWKAQWHQDFRVSHHPNPIIGLLRGALALAWILALLSLISTGMIFGWPLPAGVPIWVGLIGLFILYHAVTGPLKGARYSYGQYVYSEWDGLVDGITALFLIIACFWAYAHVPQFYEFVHHPVAEGRLWWNEIQSWWQSEA